MSVSDGLPTAGSTLRLYPLPSLLCSDSGLVEVESDGSWLPPQSSCAHARRALSVSSSIFGCCRGGREEEERKGCALRTVSRQNKGYGASLQELWTQIQIVRWYR